MHLLRNKETKKLFILLTIITVASTIAGYMITPKAGILILFVCLLLSVLFFRYLNRENRKLRLLSSRIDSILHDGTLFSPEEFTEGDLAILQDEIFKLIIRLHDQSEQLSREKEKLSDSLADISHQLKTPLTSLYLMTERLKQQETDPQKRVLLRNISQMLDRTDWLVITLLKLSKLDAGTVVYQFSDIKMKDFLQKCLEPMRISMDLRCQTCEIDCNDTIFFHGDYTWTLEAISNVLKNSLEYTPEAGTLQIHASQNPLYTELRIIDSGTGIPAEDLPHLFERFYRGKNAGRDSCGIGLSLAQMILSRENAVITAGNVPEGGGEFVIRFYHTKTI